MELSRQEYWSGLLFPSLVVLPNTGIELQPPALQANSLPSEPPGKPEEYWSGLPFPPPGHLPDPGITPVSLMSPALAGGFFITSPPGKPGYMYMHV